MFRFRQTWVQILDPIFIRSLLTLGKFFNLLDAHFAHLQNEDECSS